MSRRPTPPTRQQDRPPRVDRGRRAPSRTPQAERQDRRAQRPPRGQQQRASISRARQQVVSRASAARFAARSRARRWATWRFLLAAAAVLAALAAGAWVLLASSLLAVREVGVVGADRVDRDTVVELASGTVGTPLARVDPDAVAAAVASLPLVKEVDVVRAWPHTLEVRLVERVPVMAVPADRTFRLVDADAVVVAEVSSAPPDLPLVRLAAQPLRGGDVTSGSAATGAALVAAADVVAALPDELRVDVAQVAVTTPDDVRLELRDGDEVVWGSPADSELKSRVVQALRGQEADVYDVSAPLTPVTR